MVGYLRKILPHLVREMEGVKITEMGFDDRFRDHMHLVMIIPPKFAACDVVANLKARSAGLMRKKFLWLKKAYWKENLVWSRGFFLSTIGVNETIIKNYVKWQGKMDSEQGQLTLDL